MGAVPRSAADVRRAVDAVERISCDDESAHCEEDNLHRRVLQSIAAGTADDPAEMARVALTTTDIKFSRWYA